MIERGRWYVPSAGVLIALLTSSMFINYIDRSNLSVAAPVLQTELHYSTQQIGWLSSAFFWTYAVLQLIGVSGWICDNYPVGKIFAISFGVWSLATVCTGMLSSFAALFSMRLVLGAGESLAYPCYSRMIAMEIPQDLRGRANALLDAGSKLGPALGTFLGGLLLARYGWRIFFIALGVFGLLFLIPWLRWMPRTPASRLDFEPGDYSIRQMLTFRSAWGTFAGHFCGNYYWFFLLIWLPSYLVRDRGFSMERMASVGAIAYFVIAAGTLTAGWISDALLKRGASVTLVRKSVVVIGLLGSTAILPVGFVGNTRAAITLLFVACVAFGTYTSNHWVITQTLAGPIMAGRWTSVQNGIGNFSGIVAAWLTGAVVDRTGSFQLAFLVSGVIALVGAGMWGFVVGPVEQVSWRRQDERVAY
ncbi:MAG TPA: MFS transporter [Acidobacteriaceae bacterium]|nr:MFS transporter [Acidobacteriaceae bacterium]